MSVGDVGACGVRVDATLGCLDAGSTFVSTGSGNPGASSCRWMWRRREAGSDDVCAVRVGGRVVCWLSQDAADGYRESSPVEGRFRAVAGGVGFFCGIRIDGEVACWGDRDSGAFLSGDERDRSDYLAPAGWSPDGGMVPPGPFVALDVSRNNGEICAVRASGEMACWNNGTGTHRPPGGAFVALDAGPTATCGLRLDGAVECWGFDAPNAGCDRWSGIRRQGRSRRSVSATAMHARCAPTARRRVGAAANCASRCTIKRRSAGARYVAASRYLRDPSSPSAPATSSPVRCAPTAKQPAGACTTPGTNSNWSTRRQGRSPPSKPDSAAPAGCAPAAQGSAGTATAAPRSCSTVPSRRSPAAPSRRYPAAPLGAGCAPAAHSPAPTPPTPWRTARPASTSAPPTPPHTRLRTRPTGRHHLLVQPNRLARTHPPGPFTAVTVGESHSCGLRPDGTAECWTSHWPPSADPAYPATTRDGTGS